MKTKKWFFLSLAAMLVMLMAATALYADPIIPAPKQGDGNVWLGQGRGNGDGCGRQQRKKKRNRRGRRGNGNRNGNGNRGQRNIAFNYINLTEDQKEEIKVIFDDHKDTIDPLREGLNEARLDFRAAMRADAFDADAIKDTSGVMVDYRAALAVEMQEIKSEIKDLLTDEQLEKLDEAKDRCIGFLEGCQARIGERLELLESE